MAKKRKTKASEEIGEVAPDREDREYHSAEVRKISNGFVVRRTHDKGGKYHTTETYHPTRPKIDIGPPASGSPKAMAGAMKRFV